MHTVLIVDDDAMIVRGLEQFVDWGELGFNIVGTARDGEEGMEAIRKLQPEVVLTDIQMPYKDGLAMIEDCLRDGLSPHFVVLTGFNEFEYARRALKSRVSDYLLKPVEEQELIAVMGGIRTQIERTAKTKEDWNVLQSAVSESFSFVREKLVRELATGEISPSSIKDERLVYYNIRLADERYQVALLQGEAQLLGDDKLQEFMTSALEKRGIRLHLARGDAIGTMLLGGERDMERDVTEGLADISGKVKEWLGLTLTFGVSESGALSELKELYRQAELALQHKMFRGGGSVIAYGTIPEESGEYSPVPQEHARRLLAAVSENDEAGGLSELDDFFREIRRSGSLPSHDVYRTCSELLYEVRKALSEMGLAVDKLVGEDVSSSDKMRRHDTLEGLCDWLATILQRVRAHFDRSFEHTGGEQLDNIILYMRTHYADNIDLDVISKKFFIDPSYFCKVFKKKTGETYLHYLTQIRIDKACQLLSNPSSKVYEIASLVGYEDQRYFSQVFRKHTGMTPSDYQKSKTKN